MPISQIVNPSNSTFRFSIVKALSKHPITRRTKTHWAVFSEHSDVAMCVSPEDMTVCGWFKGKTPQFVFQFEEKNQNKLWRNLQGLLLIDKAGESNIFIGQIAIFAEIARGYEGPNRCNTDEQLMAYLATCVPLLQPQEMIFWEHRIKQTLAHSERN